MKNSAGNQKGLEAHAASYWQKGLEAHAAFYLGNSTFYMEKALCEACGLEPKQHF